MIRAPTAADDNEPLSMWHRKIRFGKILFSLVCSLWPHLLCRCVRDTIFDSSLVCRPYWEMENQKGLGWCGIGFQGLVMNFSLTTE